MLKTFRKNISDINKIRDVEEEKTADKQITNNSCDIIKIPKILQCRERNSETTKVGPC
jgi:hypothetical protein